jgi:hypothetical protein
VPSTASPTRTFADVAIWQWLALAAAIVLLIVALATQGSSTKRVATVNGTAITLGDYQRWLNAAATSEHATSSSLPGFLPDAPNYTRCIAFLRSQATKSGANVTQSTLRTDCEAYRLALAESVVQFLISSHWFLEEGVREHVNIAPAQIRSQMHGSFPTSSGLVHFLNTSGLSRSDLEFEARVYLVAQRLNQLHGGPVPTITDAQISSYYTKNKSSFGSTTLTQATPTIRQALIAQAQAPTLNRYLQKIQSYFQPRTSCAPGYRIVTYCHAK